MTVTVEKKYLILPVNMEKPATRVAFRAGDRLVFDFDAHLDFKTPTFSMYYNVEEIRGKTLEADAGDFPLQPFAQTDEKPKTDYREPLRPFVHFTTQWGWNNDPNGLVYLDGTYHLFYQHNQAGPCWGNMTWGHATSKDLLHWEERECALYPDDMGAMFSGSAIVDEENRTGLGENGVPPLLLYYTAAGSSTLRSADEPFTQCLAYSTDGGKTFRKYAGNPVIPHVEASNRDPKIVWCEELGAYVLALYLDGHTYALFRSADLLHFTMAQKIDLPLDGECPDFYPLPVENEPGVHKWVLSGATDTYILGDIDPTRPDFFVPTAENVPYYLGNRQSYAAQTFSGIPDRRVKMAWEIFHAPDSVFECEMSLPVEVTLCRVGGEYRLRTALVAEYASLWQDTREFEAQTALTLPMKRGAADVSVRASKSAGAATLTLFGHTLFLRPAQNEVEIDGYRMPLSLSGGDISLQLVVDTLGYALFADGGLLYTANAAVSDYSADTLTLQAETPVHLTVRALRSVHA